jgi:hypothetical protein
LAITSIDTHEYPSISLTVVTAAPSPGTPTLEENGEPVAGLVRENLGRAKSIVLAVDRSRSMHGKPLADAVAAARRFVAAKPDPIASPTSRLHLPRSF